MAREMGRDDGGDVLVGGPGEGVEAGGVGYDDGVVADAGDLGDDSGRVEVGF